MERDPVVQRLDEKIKRSWENNQKLLKYSVLFVFLIGLAAHAYGFLNFMIGHDSLNEFYAGQGADTWKIQLGRVLVPLYRSILRGPLPVGWMIGLTALLWVGLAVFIVSKMFGIRSIPLVALTGAVFVTNITVTAQTATYLYELDVNMFALLLAVSAAYMWQRGGVRHWLLGIVFAAGTLGFYQSYLAVTITLIMLKCILELLNGETCVNVIKKGLSGIGMLLVGGIAYLLLVKAVCAATGVALAEGNYNSMTNIFDNSVGSLLKQIGYTYIYWFGKFLQPVSSLNKTLMVIVNVLLMFFAVGKVLSTIIKKKMKVPETLLLLLLGGLLPLGMNISCWLNGGRVHHLMIYAFCLVYFLVILLVQDEKQNSEAKQIHRIWPERAALLLLAIVVWNNVGIANEAYLKRDLMQQSTHSTMTRVLDRIEQQEGYIPGVTCVAFIGQPQMEDMPGFEECSRLVGLTGNSQITYYSNYRNYFRYILNEPLNLCSEADCAQLLEQQEVKEMPVFPQNGCVRTVGDVIVVKVAETED